VSSDRIEPEEETVPVVAVPNLWNYMA